MTARWLTPLVVAWSPLDDLASASARLAELRGVSVDSVTIEPRPPFGLVVRAPGFVRTFASVEAIARYCEARLSNTDTTAPQCAEEAL